MKLTFLCKKNDGFGTTYRLLSFICIEKARKAYLELLSNELKTPNLHDDFDEQFEMFLESAQNSI